MGFKRDERITIEQATKKCPKFGEYMLDAALCVIPSRKNYATFFVKTGGHIKRDCSWMLEVPVEVYEFIGKNRFTGEEALQAYKELIIASRG